MTHTFKTLLLGSAAVLTLGVSGAMAQGSMSDNMDASAQAEVNTNYQTPSSPEANAYESDTSAGGQEDEFVPSERNTVSDTLGTTNTGAQDTAATSVNSADIDTEEVADVQKKLKAEGFNVSVDGIIGNQTRQALRSYQSANNLSATGEINAETMNALEVSSR